jgi:hypothetical protein
VVDLAVEQPGIYPCTVCILTYTLDGKWLTRHLSGEYQLDFIRHSQHRVTLRYDRLLLGNGAYLLSVATYKVLDLDDLSTAEFYEILARSYRIQVRDADPADETCFHHPAIWTLCTAGSDIDDGVGAGGFAEVTATCLSAPPALPR